jgi:hypothetical protein
MTNRLLITIAALGLSSTVVLAQTVTPPVTAPASPTPDTTVPVAAQAKATDAAKTPATTDMNAKPGSTAKDMPPLSGANSFTEAQARERIIKSGFTKVETLTKDTEGVWRGKGTKGDKSVSVAIDFKGNIVVTQ